MKNVKYCEKSIHYSAEVIEQRKDLKGEKLRSGYIYNIFGHLNKSIISYSNMIDSGLILVLQYRCLTRKLVFH